MLCSRGSFSASPNESVVSCLLFISKIFSWVCVNRALKRKLNQLAKQLFSLCIEQFRLRPKQNPNGFEKKGIGLVFFLFLPHVLACVAPPWRWSVFQMGFLNINLCVDTEGHEGETGYSSPPSSGGGGIDALSGGLQRRGRAAGDQVQQEAKESCDVLLLITWSPRPSACRCALD